MNRFIEILAVQRPSPIGVDENNRVMFSVNFDALAAAPVNDWEESIASILVSQGLSTLGTDTFFGPAAILPVSDGPYITLIDTGGYYTEITHSDDRYERLSIQILTRALNYTVARTRALAIWRALDGKRNFTI